MSSIQEIVVIGAGVMGSGIAPVTAPDVVDVVCGVALTCGKNPVVVQDAATEGWTP
jgi:3-hydroxyacyl-CoA dehydrogenase